MRPRVHPYCARCRREFPLELNELLTGRRFECPNEDTLNDPHIAAVGNTPRAWLHIQQWLMWLQMKHWEAPTILGIWSTVIALVLWGISESRSGAMLWASRFLAVVMILQTLVYNVSVVFGKPRARNPLRSALYAVWGFLIIAGGFALLEMSLAEQFEPPLNAFAAMYFSIMTITTVGYGDFHPKGDSILAEGLAALEVTVGIFFALMLLSSFASLSREGSPTLPTLRELKNESDRLDEDYSTYRTIRA